MSDDLGPVLMIALPGSRPGLPAGEFSGTAAPGPAKTICRRATAKRVFPARPPVDDAARSRAGDADRSGALAREARVLARTHAHDSLEAQALYHLASIAHQQGRPEDAFALASEAIDLAEDGAAFLEGLIDYLRGRKR